MTASDIKDLAKKVVMEAKEKGIDYNWGKKIYNISLTMQEREYILLSDLIQLYADYIILGKQSKHNTKVLSDGYIKTYEKEREDD